MKLLQQMLCIAIVLNTVCATASAQEIPYGVSDRQKLTAILNESKSHLASRADDLKWLEAAGIASHQLASLEVKSASEDAVMYLKQAVILSPENAELQAYLGSAYAMLGRDSGFVVNKVSNVNKGLALLDKAVKKSPADLMVRFIRGSVSYGVPAMFSRKEIAESDYLFFVKGAEAGVAVSPDRLAEAYYKLGKLATDKKQKTAADTYFRKAREAMPQSRWAEQAAKAGA